MRAFRRSNRLVLLGFASSIVMSAAPVSAQPSKQSWPQRAVRVIVPNPPGVALDVSLRLFAEPLSARWKQPVVVENLPGADGIIAAREFVGRRDNDTLLYSFAGLISINPLLHEKLPYDPARDLTPIASTTDNFIAIAVPASSKINSLKELEQLARSRPGKLTWAATPGLPYYALASFQKSNGLDMVQASYRDFSPAFVDLREGRIDALASGVAPLLSQARAGKIKLLAFINRERAAAAPDVPTAAEAGYPQLTFSAITGFFGWRDMPNALREHIAADIRAVTAEPAIKDRLAKMGAVALGSTPAEFAAAIEAQRAKVAAIATAMSVKPVN
ncbi:MAG: tripartite tricarboxylate transporter substrate binding protein [Rhizobiales bacterium]|nr:tripartite tricarboxylate transporter substrate binding protein [Hyphomicrobiales bacterium]